MDTPNPVDRFRDPVYTGSNRCWPCTAVNLCIVAVGAAAVSALSLVAGLGVAGLGIALVWLRGYVLPGTPTLTRRYLPTWVLARFGKVPGGTSPPGGNPTEQLSALGVLSDEDAHLHPAFREAWGETAAALSESKRVLRRAVGEVLAVPPADVRIETSERDVELTVAGDWVGQWPSQTALVADVATELTLAETAWTGFDHPTRADLAARIRGLTEQCPVCESETRVSEDTVRSCCGAADVVAVTCPECGARLAEFDPAPAAFAPGQ
ncbi:hypothetical protein [Salinirubrum litoreum]|uniref:Zinc ribbon domain-containing protein n=1 Tax=Salinirubrum litoreum TaxID=1126234 RepID=A0ABD5RH01_9EURY|nr:hypothetical protein [Salinirubrum litoreum]